MHSVFRNERCVARNWLQVLLACWLGLLAACSAPPPPAATAPAAELNPSLTLVQADGEQYEGRPALRLQFDRPLAAGQPFDELLDVQAPDGSRPDGSWVLDADTQVLRFPFIAANQTYQLSLQGTLAAADGSALGSKQQREVYSGNLPPLLAFASAGSVLRSGDEAGLPVVSVNAAEADIEFFRVRPQRYSQFFAEWTSNGQRGSWELGEIAKLADSVYSNRFALDATANERRISHVAVQSIAELREPGLFFAVMKRPGDFDSTYQTTHFVVTDLGLHVRSYPKGQWVHVASLASGQPRSGVQLELRDDKGVLLASAETDGQGAAELAVAARPEQVLLARAGSEIALLSLRQPALDLAEFAVAGRPQTALDAFVWSARDLYRPGETLQVTALLRDYDGRLQGEAPPLFAVLRQPDGRALSPRPLEPGELAAYRFEFPFADDAPTGRWQLEVHADPKASQVLGRFDFRLEEFLPERLKLSLQTDQAPLAPGSSFDLAIEGAYLYGAPAAGNRFTAELLYRPALHPVASHADFFFADPKAEVPQEPQSAVDGKLDPQGKLQSSIALIDDESLGRGPIDVRVAGSLFESGGRAIRRSLLRTVWPADELVGVRPLFDPDDGADVNTAVGFEVLRSDAQGQLAAGPVNARLVREIRDYHWAWSEDGGWSTDFSRREEVVETQTLDLAAERATPVSFRVDWGDYRLEIDDPATGLTLRFPFRAGWSWSDDNRGIDARPDKVKLALDETHYRSGDTATVTLTPPHEGPGLLLVESDQLISVQPIQARAGLQLQLPVTDAWERHDVYITALVFRPSASNEPASPPRAVGVVHVPMQRRERVVELAVTAPDRVRPGDAIDVTLSAPALAGQTAFAEIDAVDQGVLSLTGYAVPDAAAYFFAQRGLGVESRDVYGRLIERLQGQRAQLRYGGDAALAALPQARRPTARVKTAAVHAGPVAFDAKGKAKVRLLAPEFNGALRVAALAYSADRYGSAAAETLVRAPLVVEVSTPRVMAPGDRAQLAVDLHNLGDAAQQVELRVQGDALLNVDAATQTVELAPEQRRTLLLPISARTGSGVAHFKVEASSVLGRWQRDFELAVRPAWPAERRSRAREVAAPARVALAGGDLLEGLEPASSRIRVALSTVPPIPFGSAVEGLIGYPHGCIEQTSSRLWPLIWADAEAQQRFGLPVLAEDERQKRIRGGFDRINAMQLASGQFGYWPGDSYANPQMTAYVSELLLEARDLGVAIPEAVLDRALDRLNEDLLGGGDGYWSYDHAAHLRFASLAHAGYVLARAGRAPLGALRSLYDHERGNSVTALPLVQLAIALKLQGDAQRADQALAEALEKQPERPDYLGDYGSSLRDEALLLAMLYENGIAAADLAERTVAIARQVRGEPSPERRWLSTQEQLALFRLGRQLLKSEATQLQGRWLLDGASEDLPTAVISERSLDLAQGSRAAVELDNSGPVWVVEDAIGPPSRAPKPVDAGLRVRRSWYSMDGKPFTGSSLREGDTLLVRISLEADTAMPDALVSDLLPGGLEVENLGLGDRETLEALTVDGVTLSERQWSAEILHEEYRDDRYTAAVKLWAGQTAKMFYLVRAVSPGRYQVPPAFAEDMYRPDIRSIAPNTQDVIEVLPASD